MRPGCASLLFAPGHFHAHGHFVFDRNGQEGRRVDLEIGKRCGNGPGDACFVALRDLLKGRSLRERAAAKAMLAVSSTPGAMVTLRVLEL
jgi:hypothetical protein